MADNIKQIIEEAAKKTGEETRRHFDVVAEDLEAKLDAVAQQVAVNTELLQEQGQRLDRVDSRLDVMETILESVNLPALKQKINHLEERVAVLEASQKP